MKYRLLIKDSILDEVSYGDWHTEEELPVLQKTVKSWENHPLVTVIIEECEDDNIQNIA